MSYATQYTDASSQAFQQRLQECLCNAAISIAHGFR